MDYSKTINLPATDFPMKANLAQREPEMLKKWESMNLYNRILNKRQNKDLYILHDGPPYANGNIHMGHALNKILKDMIVKHKSMLGYRSPYVPGWDCHGLPIEHAVTKDMMHKSKDVSKIDIRKKCREFATKYINIQMQEFKRLGVFGNYEKPYLTMSPDYEATIVEVFGKIMEKGYIYRSKKPIYWCSSCVTALAEAEVEYEDHVSTSIYVKFKVAPSSVTFNGVDKNNLYVVIWTTTPWTLPANLAVSFHPDFQYSAYKFDNEYYIMAKGLVAAFEEATGKRKSAEVPLTGEQIAEMDVRHPFIDRESKVIFGDHVTLEAGTGIVHTAPGHGMEDYIVGLEYNLDVFCPVDDFGKFTDEYADMKGIHVFDANPKVVELLKSKGALIQSGEISHSYPHCWRCKKPVIYRATPQWFFKIDHDDLRKKGLDAVDKTKWIPSWGYSRFRSMAEKRPDWCLSRQRSWGVPIPSFRCKKCDTNMMTAKSVFHFANISKTKSIDSWYTEDINNLIPAGTKCECGSTEFEKEFDILDVWFDSGVSSFAVLESGNWKELRWPAELYLEGSDQHRGWFQSSIWPAVALHGRAPYDAVLTHGFLLDDKGKAMSKSMGNVIPPDNIIKQYGADILRLWVASEDYRNDVRIGMDMIKQISDSYRKIRNTFKFIIGNLSDFSAGAAVAYDKLPDVDKWILHELYQLSKDSLQAYENFEFHLVYRKVLNFCAVELSSIYFDISKDILYIEEKNSLKRRSVQTALKEIYETLVRLIAPVLSFTGEEVWHFNGNTDSIHEQEYYKLNEQYYNEAISEKMEAIVAIKKDVLKALETKRAEKVIGTSLEADVTLYCQNKNVMQWLKDMGSGITQFLQVASVVIADAKQPDMNDLDNSSVKISKTTGTKCVRCWNYTKEIGTDKDHPELCPRCTGIVKKL